MPTATDLVTDLPADFEVFGQAVATSLADLLGGTTGQVLSKTTNANMDFTWVTTDDTNAIQNAIVDAKGDLIAATAADTPARLAVGTNGHILTADSTAATGLKWAAPAGGGKVLQVVSGTYSTATVISSTTFTDSGLSVTITPTSATSKILVMVLQGVFTSAGDRSALAGFQIVRGATTVWAGGSTTKDTYGVLGATASDYERLVTPLNLTYLDSPATTSATTYKTQGAVENTANSADVRFQWQSVESQMILMEIGA